MVLTFLILGLGLLAGAALWLPWWAVASLAGPRR